MYYQKNEVENLEKHIYKDSRTSYLVVEPEIDISSSLSMNMMKNNKIQCFLDMECRYIDNNLVLYYKIQGMQCLKEYIEEYKLDYSMAKQIYFGIAQSVINGGEFFLDENSYILDLEYIYWDKKNKRVKLCCIPEWQGDFQRDIKKFAENIITYINHSDKAAEKFIYDIYGLITDDGFVAADIKSYIKEFKLNGEAFKNDSKNSQNDVQDRDDENSSIKLSENRQKNNRITKKYGLSVENISIPFGCFKKGRTDILTKENILEISIGRCKDCSIVLPFSIISRYHAVLYITDKKFYIEDIGSLNGTYINGQKIPANVKTLFSGKDIISFASINCRVISR